MIRRNSILAAGLAAGISGAAAAVETSSAPQSVPATAPAGLRLAQAGEVEVYFDAAGRRVLVDAQTGEVIAVEAPDGDGWQDRRGRGLDRLRGSGILSTIPRGDPDVVDRYRRFREQQLGLREAPEWGYRRPRERDWREPRYGERPYDRRYEEAYPDETDRVYREAPIERRPLPGGDYALGDPQSESAFPENPVTGSTPPAERLPAAPAVPSAPSGESVAKLQVLLDRTGASPGVIDGRMGSNVQKALAAYAELAGTAIDPSNAAAIDAALAETGGPAFETYELTAEDVAGPYVASVPEDYGQKAQLERLAYTSTTEMLAERFHMDEDYLKALNPSVDFNRPGMLVKVAVPGKARTAKVNRIVADKGAKQVRGYDREGNLVVAYPATIGSSDTPSPSGTVKVERIAFDPEYTYNPKINFKQGANDKVLTIPPGPNGPVGSIWIALSKPTYGIHGTPEPSRIGKTNSHGCVRLTNWDAAELAKMVEPGIFVQFID